MRLKIILILLFSFLFFSHKGQAQDSIRKVYKSKKTKGISETKSQKVAEELKESLIKGDESSIGRNYESLAQALTEKGEYARAEDYLKKAILIFTRNNSSEDIARATRSLAKIQESQNKVGDAILNYEVAKTKSEDKEFSQINSNDANRLRNSKNPQVQNSYSNANIKLLENENKKEAADAYIQQAQTNLKLNDKKTAISSLEKAIDLSNDEPLKVAKLTNEIAKVYAVNKEYNKAIEVNEDLLHKATEKGDFTVQVKQMQALSDIYFQKKEASKGIEFLKQSYKLAMEKGNTEEVKKSLSKLLTYFKKTKNNKEALLLYDQFFNSFDSLIAKDSSLVDNKIFEATEEKIKQLEKEKLLKDELISRKNKFNYMLIALLGIVLLSLLLIAKALYSIKAKNKKIALQSLRREMNPHFIFNSLNSVNQFISQNKELEANKYLTSYSTLMRNIMENSNNDFVSLTNEIEQLKKYLDLEHLRFNDKFDYKIFVDENLDTDAVLVPNMILQPHLENAIWHGLRYKNEKGILNVNFLIKNDKIEVVINDNGIGLSRSQELKTQNQKIHESRGIKNIKERITLLNDLYKTQIHFDIKEKENEMGTQVIVSFPLLYKI